MKLGIVERVLAKARVEKYKKEREESAKKIPLNPEPTDLAVILTKEERDLIAGQLNALRDTHKNRALYYEHYKDADQRAKTFELYRRYKKKFIYYTHCIANIDTLLTKLGVE